MKQFQRVEQVALWSVGRVLFREGADPDGIYLVHSGRVDLVFSGRNGLTKPLRGLKAGTIAGLSDAVANFPHDCTATVRVAARIGFVPIASLRRLLDEQPALWLSVAEALSMDLNACWGSMRDLTAVR